MSLDRRIVAERGDPGEIDRLDRNGKGFLTSAVGDHIRYSYERGWNPIRYGWSIMDKSSKAVEAALARVRELQAACRAAKKFTVEYDRLIFLALPAAEAAHLAALRAEKIPRADCADCQRRFKRDEPMLWQWRYGRQPVQLCLRCVRSEHKDDHAERLAELDYFPAQN